MASITVWPRFPKPRRALRWIKSLKTLPKPQNRARHQSGGFLVHLLSLSLQKLVYLKVSGGVLQVFRNEAALGFICLLIWRVAHKEFIVCVTVNILIICVKTLLVKPGKMTADEFDFSYLAVKCKINFSFDTGEISSFETKSLSRTYLLRVGFILRE